ncbi:PREDICTED: CBS domain-containing protein CBSCBSPB5-like isoform X1 [Lupinus angustifolius]|uniref:CBS domain-containing protein CBSCBSPB5-like isoform X1 n=2 Tax=Lupinus angustifolius TaxID=3871 RepID=UPI00092EA4AF|nr:PREDICTED: CBS domain-containing protein CBSCBSPB5-like isoform X1 [Lupinus angustifolius]XP_019419092.1 PREDICTED: CBS domain-containing protein CBSCBSPB5-like isoform X1 [Lupinus angustifolius]
MASQRDSSRRSFSSAKRTSESGVPHSTARKSLSSIRSPLGLTGERTVKSLRLSKALTVPDTATIYEACRRMAARRVDALLLTDSNGMLCGILTDKDIVTRVIARDINLEETSVSKVMTKNPTFVLSESLAVEALQKMVQGKFRHLPVVENGEVVALLDIAKCLYDAIARMERAAEKGNAIAAAVEGVEKQWGSSASVSNLSFIETLREQIFKPALSTIIPDNSKVVTVSPEDSVLTTTKKMLELRASSAIVIVDGKPRGILTSKDILMRVITQRLPLESTPVEKVMTPNPECAVIDTSIVDALHTMHDGKFLHLPVVDRDGSVVAVVDVIHVTHAAVTTVIQVGNNEAATSMMQRFWDSAMVSTPNDDDDETRSDNSLIMASEGGEIGRSLPYISSSMSNTFSFKVQDKKGRMHRFTCDTGSMTDVITSILQRLGDDIEPNNLPQIMYEDEDHDKVVLASDSDLAAAVDHARTAGLKGLRLHLDYAGTNSTSLEYANSESWASAYSAVAAGAAFVAGLGLLSYFKQV